MPSSTKENKTNKLFKNLQSKKHLPPNATNTVVGGKLVDLIFPRSNVEPAKWDREIDNRALDFFSPAGVKHDAGKLEWSLLPWREVKQVVKVLTLGAQKYSRENWQHVPGAERRYFDAAMRHLTARRMGEINDPETKLPHLAHAVCCLLFHLWFDNNKKRGHK